MERGGAGQDKCNPNQPPPPTSEQVLHLPGRSAFSRGIGPIPPNAALVFDVELIAVGVCPEPSLGSEGVGQPSISTFLQWLAVGRGCQLTHFGK